MVWIGNVTRLDPLSIFRATIGGVDTEVDNNKLTYKRSGADWSFRSGTSQGVNE